MRPAIFLLHGNLENLEDYAVPLIGPLLLDVVPLPKVNASYGLQMTLLSSVANAQASISGHSMGGHGALTIGLKHPELYQSISAFSPISNPMNVPWGQKAFSGYLGDDKEVWKHYDATELVGTCKTAGHLTLPCMQNQMQCRCRCRRRLQMQCMLHL